MTDTSVRNPIDVACSFCHAHPGVPCTSVGAKPLIGDVHMVRLKAAGVPVAGWQAAIAAYVDAALIVTFGYVTPMLRVRAKKERSLDVTKRWVIKEMEASRESTGSRVDPSRSSTDEETLIDLADDEADFEEQPEYARTVNRSAKRAKQGKQRKPPPTPKRR